MADKGNKYKYVVVSVQQGFIRSTTGNAVKGYTVEFIPESSEKQYSIESVSLEAEVIDNMIQEKIHNLMLVSNLGS